MFSSVVQHYNWQAAAAVVLLTAAIITIGKYLVFKVPAIKRMRDINIEEDNKRLAQEKYPAMIKKGKTAGFAILFPFYFLVLPFCATFEHVSIARVLLEIFVILMVYDFFYYLTHRFLLHAPHDSRLGYFRRVHAVHHQARDPSWVDATYVHPLEIAIVSRRLEFGSTRPSQPHLISWVNTCQPALRTPANSDRKRLNDDPGRCRWSMTSTAAP